MSESEKHPPDSTVKPRARSGAFWAYTSLTVGFLIPSTTIFFLDVFIGLNSPKSAWETILTRQFAAGDNLFVLALYGLIPFMVLWGCVSACRSSPVADPGHVRGRWRSDRRFKFHDRGALRRLVSALRRRTHVVYGCDRLRIHPVLLSRAAGSRPARGLGCVLDFPSTRRIQGNDYCHDRQGSTPPSVGSLASTGGRAVSSAKRAVRLRTMES